MARQRTPDSQPIRRFAGVDDREADVELPSSFRDWLLERRKTLAALIGLPVTYVFLKLGIEGVLGADLTSEVKAGIETLVLGAIVHQVPNKKASS